MRFVHHHDDFTATANRLVSGDLLHFEALKRSRNVVLSDVVRGEFLEKLLSTYLCQPCRQKKNFVRHIATIAGIGTGYAMLHRNAAESSMTGSS